MTWILTLIFLALLSFYLGWQLRRRILDPLSQLRHTLSDAGVDAGQSISSSIRHTIAHMKELADRSDHAETSLVLFETILERTHDGIVVVDSDLRIVLANKAATGLFGQAGTSLEGRRLTHMTREKLIYDGFRNALSRQAPFEGKFDLIDGVERRTFQLRIVPLSPNKAAGVLVDITRLERLERVRQEFLANVSHELRTPLTSIRAYVETLLDGAIADPEHNIRFLEIIQKHAERLTSLVSDIADLSAIESGHVQLEPARFDLRQLVDEVIETIKPRAEALQVSLVNEISVDLTITADRRRFEQILLNLMDNGVKFNRPGGRVCVRAGREDGEVAISVIDTGIGIAPADLPRVFERFYRVDKARSIELGGTGLGLAIVKHLVRIHGGRIAVESEPGKGTCFTIRWPAKEPPERSKGVG